VETLCSACGLCCDGTLFTTVTLVGGDLPRPEPRSRLSLFVRDELASFHLPCPLHTGHSCSVYDDRPSSCARYRCDLLKAVENETLTVGEAKLLVAEAHALLRRLRRRVTFEANTPLAISTWNEPPSGLSAAAKTAWCGAVNHLREHFLSSLLEASRPSPV